MNNSHMTAEFMDRIANTRTSTGRLLGKPKRAMLGDYPEPFIEQVRPATSMPQPPGPADFPITNPVTDPTATDLLERILEELIKQNTATKPVIRAIDVDATGQTLDWSMVGIMDRLIIRNKGTSSLWFGFDKNGPAVVAFTSDESWELQAQESVNLTHCLFQKIGVICAAMGTATVHAIGFQSVAGNQAGSIS